MKILHIVPDEKFIDTAYELFEEVAPEANDFLILGEERELKHIKKARCQFSGSRFFIPKAVIESLQDYSFIVLHSLGGLAKHLVVRAPKGTKFAWVGFGFDYYPIIKEFRDKLLLGKTKL